MLTPHNIDIAMPEEALRMLAKRVRQWRLRNGWTQKDLAHLAGIPLGTYRHFELTGQLSLLRFIYVVHALGFPSEIAELLPAPEPRSLCELVMPPRQRGRRTGATHNR